MANVRKKTFKIKIDSKGDVSNDNLTISNGDIVTFHSASKHSWEIAFYIKETGHHHSLPILVPGHRSASIVGDSEIGKDACRYDVYRPRNPALPEEPRKGRGNNQIIIGQRRR